MKSLDQSGTTNERSDSALPILPAIYPLDSFYAAEHRALPSLEVIPGPDVPEPYRSLLVHNNDMTSTLEKFHAGRVLINIIKCDQRDSFYFRSLILILERTGQRVEFGAIRINLTLVSAEARRLILAGSVPLGRILADTGMRFSSHPKAFLKVIADDYLNTALGLTGAESLYGRRNTLSDGNNRAFAEIVEILPP